MLNQKLCPPDEYFCVIFQIRASLSVAERIKSNATVSDEVRDIAGLGRTVNTSLPLGTGEAPNFSDPDDILTNETNSSSVGQKLHNNDAKIYSSLDNFNVTENLKINLFGHKNMTLFNDPSNILHVDNEHFEKETTEATFNRLDFDAQEDIAIPTANGRPTLPYDNPKNIFLIDTSSISSGSSSVSVNDQNFILAKNSSIGKEIKNKSFGILVADYQEESTSNQTSYRIHNLDGIEAEKDEGFIKLRSIIHAAEQSILDFQNDIQGSNVYPKLRKPDLRKGKTSWLRPNGRFDTGFWDDWSGIQNMSQMQTFKGKPMRSVWTPTARDTAHIKYKNKYSNGNPKQRKFNGVSHELVSKPKTLFHERRHRNEDNEGLSLN